jgi:hypothetical protein
VPARAPAANELVYDACNAVSCACTFSERLKEAFRHVASYSGHVNLGCKRGAALDDPQSRRCAGGGHPHGLAETVRALVTLFALLAGVAAQGAEFVAPYVDTVEEDVELILDLADVGPGDYLIDLGSGDGRFVIGAARRGALAHGVELEPTLVERARRNAEAAGVAARTAFLEGDVFAADVSMATVVTLYLFPEANIALRPKLLAELAPGTRLVSNSFHMGDWAPDARAQGRTSGGALLWVVPAQVEGHWRLTVGERAGRLELRQRYQEIEAALEFDDREAAIETATLRGDVLTIVAATDAGALALRARAVGDTLTGSAQAGEQVLTLTGNRERE